LYFIYYVSCSGRRRYLAKIVHPCDESSLVGIMEHCKALYCILNVEEGKHPIFRRPDIERLAPDRCFYEPWIVLAEPKCPYIRPDQLGKPDAAKIDVEL